MVAISEILCLTDFAIFGQEISIEMAEKWLYLTLLALSVLSLLGGFIARLIAKFKKAKEDGKISKEELEDIANDVKSLRDDLEPYIPKGEKK